MLPKTVYYHGSEESPPERIELYAGPLSMVFEPDLGFLRYIRFNDTEILRGIYVAVRDRNWGTVSPAVSNLEVEKEADEFNLTFDVECKEGEIDFFWKGRITGDSDGRVKFSMDGTARSTFKRNRIGFCILHPLACAGKAATVAKVEGTVEQGKFPQDISPHQPFFDMHSIAHEVAPGLLAEVTFDGDVFEMEDQRNWTDASYKTYCTPLGLPFPVEINDGTAISQSVTLKLKGELAEGLSSTGAQTKEVVFTVAETATTRLPRIGLGMASHGEHLSEREIGRLKALNLSHLRVDLHFSHPNIEETLQGATEQANALGASLEAALSLTDAAESELKSLAQIIRKVRPPISTYLIFHTEETSTSSKWIQLARQLLGDVIPGAKIGSGTDGFFAEFNRERPQIDVSDLVSFSISPQCHSIDSESLIETLEAQAHTVRSARKFVGDLRLAVSSITFKPRTNPSATGPEPETPPGQLPSQVDVRQMSLFGAGWTIGSLKYLSESNVYSITYYETSGWRGIMEREDGSPIPDLFRSIPGSVFPLYHVFADVGEFLGGSIIPSTTSAPLNVEGIAIQKEGRTRILLANLESTPQDVRLVYPGLGAKVRVRQLDETNVEETMRSPESFRSIKGRIAETEDKALQLSLLPYASVRIDSGE